MSCQAFAELQDFLRRSEVATLYTSVRKLQRPKLEEALRMRKVDWEIGDEDSTLRAKLLYFDVQFYHPEIGVPDVRLSEVEAANLRVQAEAMRDMASLICRESAKEARLRTERMEQTTSSVKTSTDATNTSSASSADPERQLKYRLNCIKLLKVCELQYSGTRGLPAQEFLENLRNFRRFSKVHDHVLLDMLPCVLDTATRKWYRSSKFADWSSFERKFAEDHVSVAKNPEPVRTFQDLQDSLHEIGFQTPIASSSRRSSMCSSASSTSIKTPRVAPIRPQPRPQQNLDVDANVFQAAPPFSRTIGSNVHIHNNNNNAVSASISIPKATYNYAPLCPPLAYIPVGNPFVSTLSPNFAASHTSNWPFIANRYANGFYPPSGYY